MTDQKGRFGIHGGQYIPETLMNAVQELESAYGHYKNDPEFQAELTDLLNDYAGRPSWLYFAKKVTEDLGGAKVYLKREDLNHTGAHKISNVLGQALLAKKMGKTRLIAETGAGQHGVATATAAALEKTVGGEYFLHTTGNRCDGSLPLPKLMWLKEHRPELYARTAHILISSKDFFLARLTGVCAGDVTACATAGAMDIRRKCWDERLLSAAGVDEKLFPALYHPHRQVGAVLPEMEAACGYRPGTAVFAGIGDAGATTLASGIRQPGQYNINLGTSGWVAAVSDDILLTEAGVFNLAAAAEGCYINVVPFLNAGNVHKWISGVLGGMVGTADYESVSALLKNSVPGSHGVLFLPYLAGERFPILDPEARGCFFGMTTETTAADLARACLEGVAFSLRQGLEQFPVPPASISLIGGGSREAVWCQILADVLDHDLTVLSDTEFRAAQALASLARQGAGGPALAEDGTVCRPRSEYRALYDAQYARYQKLYPALRTV